MYSIFSFHQLEILWNQEDSPIQILFIHTIWWGDLPIPLPLRPGTHQSLENSHGQIAKSTSKNPEEPIFFFGQQNKWRKPIWRKMSHDHYFDVHMLWQISCFVVDKLEQRQQSRKQLPRWQLFSMRSRRSTFGWCDASSEKLCHPFVSDLPFTPCGNGSPLETIPIENKASLTPPSCEES